MSPKRILKEGPNLTYDRNESLNTPGYIQYDTRSLLFADL